MVETICYFNKEALVIKAPKRSPLVLRTVVLPFAMVCGVYICSMCLKQTSPRTKTKLLNIKVIHQPCQSTSIQQSEIPFLHYPNPVTFSSDQGVGGFDILNSHADVSSNGEIFSVNHRRISISSIVSMMDGVYNLDWFTGASKNECSAAVGFKWTMNQGLMQHHNDIAEYFKKKRVSAIFLFRRNLLRKMISILANSYHRNAELLNGTHKSHVHSPAEAKILAKYKPTINAMLLIPERKEIEQTTAKAIEYFKSTSQIVLYCWILSPSGPNSKEAQEFLRLPYRELTSRRVKIRSGPLSKQVENWDDDQIALKGTSYERFLHSDYHM